MCPIQIPFPILLAIHRLMRNFAVAVRNGKILRPIVHSIIVQPSLPSCLGKNCGMAVDHNAPLLDESRIWSEESPQTSLGQLHHCPLVGMNMTLSDRFTRSKIYLVSVERSRLLLLVREGGPSYVLRFNQGRFIRTKIYVLSVERSRLSLQVRYVTVGQMFYPARLKATPLTASNGLVDDTFNAHYR